MKTYKEFITERRDTGIDELLVEIGEKEKKMILEEIGKMIEEEEGELGK
jgi:hypothetical protein